MTCRLRVLAATLCLASFSAASELPDSPGAKLSSSDASPAVTTMAFVSQPAKPAEARVLDRRFFALAIVSSGATFADSYTTLFARQNWLAGKQNACNVEAESPYLYGRHPTVARAYAVASGKSLLAAASSYYLRKHHHKWWSVPLLANAAFGLQGVTQNIISCN